MCNMNAIFSCTRTGEPHFGLLSIWISLFFFLVFLLFLFAFVFCFFVFLGLLKAEATLTEYEMFYCKICFFILFVCLFYIVFLAQESILTKITFMRAHIIYLYKIQAVKRNCATSRCLKWRKRVEKTTTATTTGWEKH